MSRYNMPMDPYYTPGRGAPDPYGHAAPSYSEGVDSMNGGYRNPGYSEGADSGNYYGAPARTMNNVQLPAPADTGHSGWGLSQTGAGIGAGLGGIIGQLMSGADPYGAGQNWMSQIPDELKENLNKEHANYAPYIQAGQQASGPLQEQYSRMFKDPQGLIDWLSKGYTASPGYNYQVGQATQAANRAAAAGGMAGSPASQVGLAGTVNNLANQDFEQYLNRAQGIYGSGLQGEQGFVNQGYNAARDYGRSIDEYGTSLGEYLAQQAQLASKEQERQQQQDSGFGGAIGGLLGAVAPIAASFI